MDWSLFAKKDDSYISEQNTEPFYPSHRYLHCLQRYLVWPAQPDGVKAIRLQRFHVVSCQFLQGRHLLQQPIWLFCTPSPSGKRSTQKDKTLLLTLLPFRTDPFSEWGENILDEDTTPKSVSVVLKVYWIGCSQSSRSIKFPQCCCPRDNH